jgi:prophage lambdaSa04, site-specific recombinase, resolvase family
MGLNQDRNANLVINPDQVKVLKHIYHQFLKGYSPKSNPKELDTEGIKGGQEKPTGVFWQF